MILMGILLVVVSYYLIKGRHEILQGQVLTDMFSEEGIKLENISYTQTSPDEGVKWNLDAKEAKFSKDRQFITFSDFRLKLEPENRPSVELEGKRGDYDKNSGEINLHGDLQGYTTRYCVCQVLVRGFFSPIVKLINLILSPKKESSLDLPKLA